MSGELLTPSAFAYPGAEMSFTLGSNMLPSAGGQAAIDRPAFLPFGIPKRGRVDCRVSPQKVPCTAGPFNTIRTGTKVVVWSPPLLTIPRQFVTWETVIKPMALDSIASGS